MLKDALINTNPYLRDPIQREALLSKTVISSTAIEGVVLGSAEIEKSIRVSGKRVKHSTSARSSRSPR
jgi:hypothetical protein